MIDEHGESDVPGLYAIGETATGPHGTDRPGGHMIGASQVFGMIAGIHAAERAAEIGPVIAGKGLAEKALDRINAMWERKGDVRPS